MGHIDFAIVHHANQYMITNGYPNREGLDDVLGIREEHRGYRTVFELHQAYGIPFNLHLSSTLLETILWHRPEFLDHPRNLIKQGLLDIIGSSYGQNIMRFFGYQHNFRQVNECLKLRCGHLGVEPQNQKVFWPPERILDTRMLAPVLTDEELGSRQVVSYRLIFSDKAGRKAEPMLLVLKRYADQREGEKTYHTMKMLWENGFDNESKQRISKPFCYLEDLGLLVLGKARGMLLRKNLHQSGPAALDRMRAVARWLAKLHQLNVDLKKISPHPDEETSIKDFINQMGSREHPLLPKLEKLLVSVILMKLASFKNVPMTPVHGDFQCENIFVDRDSVTIVDFDRLCRSDPARDLGYIIAQMRAMAFLLAKAELRYERGLTYDDVSLIRKSIPVESVLVAPLKFIAADVRYEGRQSHANIVGTSPEHEEITNFRVETGRFISPLDLMDTKTVCVLGSEIKQELCGRGDAVTAGLRIGEVWFTVVGVMEPKELYKGKTPILKLRNINRDVYIPITTALRRFTGARDPFGINEIALKSANEKNLFDIVRLAGGVLERKHRGIKDYEIMIPKELLAQARETQRLFNIVIGAIAGISLVGSLYGLSDSGAAESCRN